MFVAQVIVGAVVSTSVTVWLHCEVLPQASLAAQVRVALKVFPHAGFVTVVTVLNEPPVIVGSSNIHVCPQGTVLFATQVIVGAVVSTTLIVWLHCAALPHASVARHVRTTL